MSNRVDKKSLTSPGVIRSSLFLVLIPLFAVRGDILTDFRAAHAFEAQVSRIEANGDIILEVGEVHGIHLGMEGNVVRSEPRNLWVARIRVKSVGRQEVRLEQYGGTIPVVPGDHIFLGKPEDRPQPEPKPDPVVQPEPEPDEPPEDKEPVPQMGRLRLNGPSGVRIEHKGSFFVAPNRWKDVEPGTYRLEISRRNYHSTNITVRVGAGQEVERRLPELRPLRGRVIIGFEVPDYARSHFGGVEKRVRLNQGNWQSFPRSPYSRELVAGEYSVEFDIKGFNLADGSRSRTFHIRPGEITSMLIRLEPRPAFLQVQGSPSTARVSVSPGNIQNRPVGMYAAVPSLKRLSVTMSAPAHRRMTRELDPILPDEHSAISLQLEPIPRPPPPIRDREPPRRDNDVALGLTVGISFISGVVGGELNLQNVGIAGGWIPRVPAGEGGFMGAVMIYSRTTDDGLQGYFALGGGKLHEDEFGTVHVGFRGGNRFRMRLGIGAAMWDRQDNDEDEFTISLDFAVGIYL